MENSLKCQEELYDLRQRSVNKSLNDPILTFLKGRS
jgi:hypothetical protein